jgi:hypothetical protein
MKYERICVLSNENNKFTFCRTNLNNRFSSTHLKEQFDFMVERAKKTHLFMSESIQPQKVGSIVEANFPKDAEGRVYHLGVKRGEGVYYFHLLISHSYKKKTKLTDPRIF